MKKTKNFKVIRILDEYRIVVNAGAEDQVTDQCYFQIMGANNEIVDPETKESLGVIPNIKELVRPILIERKFCICEHFDNRFSKKPEELPQDTMLFTNARKLNINKEQIVHCGIDEPISIRDKAVLLIMDTAKEGIHHQKSASDKKTLSRSSLLSSFFG